MSSDITADPLPVYCSTCKTRGHLWNYYFALLHCKSVSGLIYRRGGVLYYSYISTSCTSSRMYYILRKNQMLFFNMISTPTQFGIFGSFTYICTQSHIWNTLLTLWLHTFFRYKISIRNIKMNIYTIFQNAVNTKSI